MKASNDRNVKKFSKVAALAAIVLLASLNFALVLAGCSTPRAIDPGQSDEPQFPLVVGHRGAAALAPENTLAAFEAGMAAGVDMLELDIHRAADGVLVVLHDASLERNTGVKKIVSELTSDELQQLDASRTLRTFQGERQQIPTLVQVLDFLEESGNSAIALQIEIKTSADGSRYAGLEEDLVGMLHQRNFVDRVSVISFDFDSLALVRKLDPAIPLGALVGQAWMSKAGTTNAQDTAAILGDLDVDFVGISKDWLSPSLLTALRLEGLDVGVWTVDEKSQMQRFIRLGVDFITTNRPDILSALR